MHLRQQLEKWTVKDLRKLAWGLEMTGLSQKKKHEVVKALTGHEGNGAATTSPTGETDKPELEPAKPSAARKLARSAVSCISCGTCPAYGGYGSTFGHRPKKSGEGNVGGADLVRPVVFHIDNSQNGQGLS